VVRVSAALAAVTGFADAFLWVNGLWYVNEL
jgi:hypothetical protein